MMRWVKWICLALALALAVPAGLAEGLSGQLTEADIQAINGGKAAIYTHEGRVTLVAGSCSDGPVKSMGDARRVVDSMTTLLGGDGRTRFTPVRALTDARGNVYYVFRQVYADASVLGGAVKVIVDGGGNMIGLSCSVVNDLPEAAEAGGITAEAAEALVLQQPEQGALHVIEGLTDRMVLPMVLSMDDDEHETEECRFVWVVYTDNPSASVARGSDLPYLAHYVTTAGEYLYSLPTIMPGDAAGSTGFAASYVFEFMEPAEYTGCVDLSDGTEAEISVTVMRDSRTGMYYLGNIERGIVVADCYEFLYNHGSVVLEASPDNRAWDQVGLLSLYNYCRAWDYYRAMGWEGGDGRGTPIIILNNFCDANRYQVDNACYMGYALGWQLFAASRKNDYSQCLDVIAHEFTHCVTGATTTYNAYMNDCGAINEAMSDIQGNLCEMAMGATDDDTWLLGEQGLTPVRSMSDPHRFAQPEYSWDLYYKPNVRTPTGVNDRGGVHDNSSLLNNLAYRLCADGGMSLSEAGAYWFAVDCAMVPGTDYAQMRELLPFVLEALGMERYRAALDGAIEATRLGADALPETFDADRALVTLTLPDREDFTSGNWGLEILSVDFDALIQRCTGLMTRVILGQTDDFPKVVRELLEETEDEPEAGGILEVLAGGDGGSGLPDRLDALPGDDGAADAGDEGMSDEDFEELVSWLTDIFDGVFYSDLGAAGQDGRTIRMVCRPGLTVPVLIHMAFRDNSDVPDQVTFAVCVGGRWYDLGELLKLLEQAEDEQALDEVLDRLFESEAMTALIDQIAAGLDGIKSPKDALKLLALEIRGGEVCEIPVEGLEDLAVPEPSSGLDIFMPDEEANVPGRSSRPKAA